MQLKPFQHTGAAFLAGRTRALLADEMGVGKSAQVVTACAMVNARRVVVVCPAVGIQHWYREFRRWWTKPILPLLEVVSYERAVQLVKQPDFGRGDVLVLDECHYGKNPQAKRTKAIYGKGGLGWRATRIWSLSGTPMLNHPGELWPMLRAFGAIGMGYWAFVNYFCQVDWQGKIRGARLDRIDELRAILRSISLRRTKAEVLPELGEIDVQDWFVEPRADYVGAYDKHEIAGSESWLRAALFGKSTEDLLAFLSGNHEFASLRRHNALLKTPAVYDQVLFELENGLVDKIVVYGYHREPLALLRDKFQQAGVGAALIQGDTPQGKRDEIVQDWKRPAGPRVMLASIIAAGVVLDFTVAHQGIMLEMDWVDANNRQAMQRMHRQGQTCGVTIRVAIGSEIDEIVSKAFVRKAQDFAAVFGRA